jgi:hypothetical protein
LKLFVTRFETGVGELVTSFGFGDSGRCFGAAHLVLGRNHKIGNYNAGDRGEQNEDYYGR